MHILLFHFFHEERFSGSGHTSVHTQCRNFNFGISIYSEGTATQIEESFENKKYNAQSKDVKIERGFGSSISLNLKIKKFLISVTRNANKFKFKDYTCNEESCMNENIDLVNDYGSTTNSFLIGFGYNF